VPLQESTAISIAARIPEYIGSASKCSQLAPTHFTLQAFIKFRTGRNSTREEEAGFVTEW
jgi:hypothetical protein